MKFFQKNTYDKNHFKNQPSTRSLAAKVYKNFGDVGLDFERTWYQDENLRPINKYYSAEFTYQQNYTLRENLLISPHYRLFNFTVLYYIQQLVEISPDVILDVGCGHNWFKKIYPCILGLSPEDQDVEADVHTSFDKKFVKDNFEKYPAAMAICSLHFVSIDNFAEQILDFANIIKTGGRGFISFDILRSVECSHISTLKKLFGGAPNQSQLAEYINQEICKLDLDWITVENLIAENVEDSINGNIRLVFQK